MAALPFIKCRVDGNARKIDFIKPSNRQISDYLFEDLLHAEKYDERKDEP